MDDIKKAFVGLKPFMDKVALGRFRPNNGFPLCVRATLVKCYEYNIHVHGMSEKARAYFALPSLRGICEDLIVLNFKKLPARDRADLVSLLSQHEIHERIKSQGAFFDAIRPQQAILRVNDVDTTLKGLEAQICAIWNRLGWPNLKKKTMPQIVVLPSKLDKCQ